MESLDLKSFFAGKRVFVTGHSGFKGSWLCVMLHELGAQVTGYALSPHTEPNLYTLAGVGKLVDSIFADVRDRERLAYEMAIAKPEIVFHLAAQPILRASYEKPLDTYQTNILGTLHLLEAVRLCPSVRVIVNVTSDKCYENNDLDEAFLETAPLGGFDPYSSSKACSEIVTAAYRQSFFHPSRHGEHGVALATARAGNVIGGGDWSRDRLVPDCINALIKGEKVLIRNPDAVRPWQHVLEPLSGYLMLAERLYRHGQSFGGAWNFGPDDSDARTVEWMVRKLCATWGGGGYLLDEKDNPHEDRFLRLDSSKSKEKLGWRPRWTLGQAIDAIVEWNHCFLSGDSVHDVCRRQISLYKAST